MWNCSWQRRVPKKLLILGFREWGMQLVTSVGMCVCVNKCNTSAPPRQCSCWGCNQLSSGVHTFSLLFWVKYREKHSPLSCFSASLCSAWLELGMNWPNEGCKCRETSLTGGGICGCRNCTADKVRLLGLQLQRTWAVNRHLIES